MGDYGIDLAVLAASAVLLVSGLVKVVSPGPITGTLAALWSRATGRPGRSRPLVLGRMLGLVEVGLAAWIALARSVPAALAVGVFALGLAAAGVIGARGADDLPCACFGGHDRSLGYLHVAQLPLWVAAAWCVQARTDLAADLDGRLAMLAAAAALASGFHVARMWTALAPTARGRRQAAAERLLDPAASTGPRLGGSSW